MIAMKNSTATAAAARCQSEAGARTVWPPRVLDTIYRDRLQTLYDLLIHLLSRPSDGAKRGDRTTVESQRTGREAQAELAHRSDEESPPQRLATWKSERRLIRDDDPLAYITMLHKSYAVMPDIVPTLGPVSLEQRWTQRQIVDRVIELQFRQEAKPAHVLCSGYRKLRPSVVGSSRRRAPVGLECLNGNAAVDFVNSDTWRILLSRVGDTTMLYILSHVAVFTPLPNDCLFQISGVPISYSVSACRKSSLLHAGEKMLGRKAKRKFSLQTFSAQQEKDGNSVITSRRTNNARFYEGSPPCKNASSVEEHPQVFHISPDACNSVPYSNIEGTCREAPLDRSQEYHESRVAAETSCEISKSYRAKRKAQQNTLYRDNKLQPTVGSHLSGSKICKKLRIDELDDNCQQCLVKISKRHKSFAHLKEICEHNSIGDLSPVFKDSRRLRGVNFQPTGLVVEEATGLKPTPTRDKTPERAPVSCTESERIHVIPLTGKVTPLDGAPHGSLFSSVSGGSLSSRHQVPDSAGGRRVRLPSWKRRKLHQEVRRKDLPLQDCVGHPQGEELTESFQVLKKSERSGICVSKAIDETSHVPLCTSHVSHASGFAPSDGAEDTIGIVQEESSPSPQRHEKVTQSRKGKRNFSRNCNGPSQMFINRAPIFYNSNFSRHPCLPANHVLNRTKPDEAGVDQLHAAIFGTLKKSSGLSVSTDSPCHPTPTRSTRLLLKQLLVNAKRCAYARLLNRHCPPIQELNSQLAVASTPFSTASTAPFPESQDGTRISQLVEDLHDTQNVEHTDPHNSEVEEMMKLLLGPMYQSSDTGSTKAKAVNIQHDVIKSCSDSHARPNPRKGHVATEVDFEQFQNMKQEKDLADSTGTADVVATDKALRAGLIASYTHHNNVVGFLWAVCRSIIPLDMLGSKRCWRKLRSNIAHFVGLRRHEKFNVQHALFKLKLSSISWLRVPSTVAGSTQAETSTSTTLERAERVLQQRRLELWLYWLFSSLVVPLIRAHFYVTEIETHRQNVFYYRKPVWAKLHNIALNDLTQRNYKKLSKKSVAEALDEKSLGFSQVRLLPKRTGVRPIANLAAPSQGILKFKVKSQRPATLRQLFGHLDNAGILGGGDPQMTCESDGSVVGPKLLINATRGSSPLKSRHDAALDYNKMATATTSPENSRGPLFTAPVYFGKSPCQANMWRNVIPVGGVRNCKLRRKTVKRVNYSFRSVNSVLRDAYFCLKLEKDTHPEDLGSSVFGYSDIHSKVLPFVLQMKSSATAVPRLYMAVCDVTKAYDTIQQEKLLDIVSKCMRSFEYNVAKYTCVSPALASVRVSHGRAPARACEQRDFMHLVHEMAIKHSHCIFTDLGLCTCVTRDKIISMLQEHLKRNIVQMGKQFYQQTVGIPQGSILSSILCSLFYGHFEVNRLIPLLQSRLAAHLVRSSKHTVSASAYTSPLSTTEILTQPTENEVENMLDSAFELRSQDVDIGRVLPTTPSIASCCCPECRRYDPPNQQTPCHILKNSILLRLIDDSLFISTSEAAATIFVESMHRGSEEYGCQANKRKTAASFSLQLGTRVLPKKVYTTEDGACFMRWSGLLVNCYTVEFQADYTRYIGEHIKSTLTVKREGNQGWHLVLKMCQYMRPKCHALFFDPRINSPATIRLNAFQAFLLCAMKFHAYICCLPPDTGFNQPFLYEVICCTTRYMYGLLRHRMETLEAKAVEYFPFLELEWLALVAFHRILKRKQSRYQVLLQTLQTQMEALKYKKLASTSHLTSAIDEKRSSMFKYIKY